MQYDLDIHSSHAQLFLEIRGLVLGYTNIEETKKERITTYACNGYGICHIRTTKTGVDIGFLKGVLIKDVFSLLTGDTKKMRVLSLNIMNEKALRYYITESIRLND